MIKNRDNLGYVYETVWATLICKYASKYICISDNFVVDQQTFNTFGK